MLGQAKKSKVVVRKSRRNPRIRHDGNREWITDIEAINAAGEAIPPFVILKGKSYHIVGWHAGVQPDEEVRFAFSPKGWSDDVLGLTWLVENSQPQAQMFASLYAPLLFILDVHGSHGTWDFLSYYLKNNILVFCLPPHSTQLLQPLDIGIFGPLNRAYADEVDAYVRESYDIVRKGNFWPFLRNARNKAFTKSNIMGA